MHELYHKYMLYLQKVKIHFSLSDEIAEINERKKIMIVLFIWFVCFLFVFFGGEAGVRSVNFQTYVECIWICIW